MSDIFFREMGMPAEINRKLTDAISDLLFVTGGRPRRRADRRHTAEAVNPGTANPRTGTSLELPRNRDIHETNFDVPV